MQPPASTAAASGSNTPSLVSMRSALRFVAGRHGRLGCVFLFGMRGHFGGADLCSFGKAVARVVDDAIAVGKARKNFDFLAQVAAELDRLYVHDPCSIDGG